MPVKDVFGRTESAHVRCYQARQGTLRVKASVGTNFGIAGQGVNANLEVEKEFSGNYRKGRYW